jgi:hypothetical protein
LWPFTVDFLATPNVERIESCLAANASSFEIIKPFMLFGKLLFLRPYGDVRAPFLNSSERESL